MAPHLVPAVHAPTDRIALVKERLNHLRALLSDLSVATPLSIFFGSRVALYALLIVFVGLLPGDPEARPSFWQMMAQWDGEWYLQIARDGYQWLGPATQSTSGFFPLYSILGRMMGWVVGDLNWGLFLVTNISFALYLYFLYRLVTLEADHSVAERVLVYVTLFPTAFVFASFYTEATSFACIAAALYFARRGQFRFAIPIALLASLARLYGLVVILPVGYEMWKQRGLKLQLAWLAAIPLGTLAFTAYLWRLTGDPLAYFTIQRTAWFHVFTTPWETLRLALDRLSWPLTNFVTAVGWLEGGSILLFIVLTLAILKTRPAGDWLYALAVLVPVLIQTVDVEKGPPTLGAPRYLMAMIPGFIILARAGENRYVDQTIRWTFGVLQAIFAIYFFSHMWVT